MAEKHRLQTIDFAAIYDRQFARIYRVCFLYMKNRSDAEDAVSTVFLRLCEQKKPFASPEHELAWLIVCAQNVCKNELKRKHRSHLPLESAYDLADETTADETLPLLLALPEKYKAALYLYYYEGYPSVQVARILGKKESTVRTWLAKGRALLKAQLADEKGSDQP
ncbi:MAG: RNA polymerase sigma factor [Clostridia bacterium]|nr:RNA polymerase sigma factor [Clostridia bacterium]